MSDGERFTPLIHMPWLRWLDQTELPAIAAGAMLLAVFIPFYSYNALTPQTPLNASVFPPAAALSLTILLVLTRGACRDLTQLLSANKISVEVLQKLAAGPRWALVELLAGVLIGLERLYTQITYVGHGSFNLSAIMNLDGVAVGLSILIYTIVQVHLLGFCIRQVFVFRQIAASFKVDLLTPELNTALSNPLIRFIVVGLIAASFAVIVLQLAPFASQQSRIVEAALIAGFIWIVLLVISFLPLLTLKSRIAVAKTLEINVIRRALRGDFSGAQNSQFGQRLQDFSPADLMFYEDRIRNIWEWPIEGQIRQLVIFGLLPPVTWVLAAGVEIIFESVLMN